VVTTTVLSVRRSALSSSSCAIAIGAAIVIAMAEAPASKAQFERLVNFMNISSHCAQLLGTNVFSVS
jgi:hypothetical protein